jgi:hypothetical protein
MHAKFCYTDYLLSTRKLISLDKTKWDVLLTRNTSLPLPPGKSDCREQKDVWTRVYYIMPETGEETTIVKREKETKKKNRDIAALSSAGRPAGGRSASTDIYPCGR